MPNPFSRKPNVVSLEEKKRRANDMYAFLMSQPVAANSPMIDYNKLVAELSLIEGILNKLKAFVRFLSKLNPAEYLRWFHKAYASMVTPLDQSQATKGPDISTNIPLIAPIANHEKTNKKKPKSKKSKIPSL